MQASLNALLAAMLAAMTEQAQPTRQRRRGEHLEAALLHLSQAGIVTRKEPGVRKAS